MKNSRLARVAALLVCPECRHRLDVSLEGPVRCVNCGFGGSRTRSQIRLVQSEPRSDFDFLLRQKERIKRRFPAVYPRLVEILSPVYSPRLLDHFLSAVSPESHLVVDLGSGTARHHREILNVDFIAYDQVDIVCRIERLPFPDDSVDAVISIAVLEHVPNPTAVVAEIARVLKPGGRMYCYVPFMQGIHASPEDYQRYTPHGLHELFGDFADRQVRVAAGPSSGFGWLLQEWIALVFSFGSRRVFWAIYALMTAIVVPLKYADAVLMRHPLAANIASAFAIEGRKPQRD